MSYDLVIKNGTVVDGTGAARYQADVAIVDGKVAEIGSRVIFEIGNQVVVESDDPNRKMLDREVQRPFVRQVEVLRESAPDQATLIVIAGHEIEWRRRIGDRLGRRGAAQPARQPRPGRRRPGGDHPGHRRRLKGLSGHCNRAIIAG